MKKAILIKPVNWPIKKHEDHFNQKYPIGVVFNSDNGFVYYEPDSVLNGLCAFDSRFFRIIDESDSG